MHMPPPQVNKGDISLNNSVNLKDSQPIPVEDKKIEVPKPSSGFKK
jgi:hypothetical protein